MRAALILFCCGLLAWAARGIMRLATALAAARDAAACSEHMAAVAARLEGALFFSALLWLALLFILIVAILED